MYEVRCPTHHVSGADSRRRFPTLNEALHWANYGHACLAVSEHKIDRVRTTSPQITHPCVTGCISTPSTASGFSPYDDFRKAQREAFDAAVEAKRVAAALAQPLPQRPANVSASLELIGR